STKEPIQKEIEQVEARDIIENDPEMPQEVDPEEIVPSTNKSKKEKKKAKNGKKSSASSKTVSRIASADRLMPLAVDGSENLTEDIIPRAPFVESVREDPAFEAASIPLPRDDRDELEQVQADRDDDQEEQPIEPYAGPATMEGSGAQSENRTVPVDA